MISRPSLEFLYQDSCLLDMLLAQIYILGENSVGISLNSKSRYKYEKHIILVIRIYYHLLKVFIIYWTLTVISLNPHNNPRWSVSLFSLFFFIFPILISQIKLVV